jgi:hypothetical protein
MENKFTPIEFTTTPQQERVSQSDLNRPIEIDIFDAKSSNDEVESLPSMSFKEWRDQSYSAEPGMLIVDVPPRALFTTQDWLIEDKMLRAVNAQTEEVDDAFTVKGVIFNHPKEHVGTIPVVLEGNHRAVNAAMHGERVIFSVTENTLDPKAEVWRMTNLVKKYGNLIDR